MSAEAQEAYALGWDSVQELHDAYKLLVGERDQLVLALHRRRSNFVRAVQGKPVRDTAETLAEVDACLGAAPNSDPTEEGT